jgi:hypothetical protein
VYLPIPNRSPAEDHELKNGVHLASINGNQEVPNSKVAIKLSSQQVRSVTVATKKQVIVTSVEPVKGRDKTAPIVLAVTVEGTE